MTDRPGPTVGGIPLLETKLYAPGWRPGLVSRPRLVERLERGATRALTLVCAPPGFGKTTLLAEWLAAAPPGGRAAAWVSLDPADNDPALFWAYVIAALGKVRPGVGARARALLRSPQPPPIEAVLTLLINDLAATKDDVALVLDDYHVVAAEPVHAAVAFLLDHRPPRLHLVLASRADPPLPLARLRARGEATELRAADLRFAPDEAAAFLRGAMGLDLAAGDVAALETRTEGWIAGLQLAALSLRGRADAPAFVRAFAGDDRHVADYLVDEVLERQPEPVRTFLLQTAILDRLSGPLCDAVTGRDDGAATLAALERGNLFVVPLDDTRRWYRYHHLFADVLRAHAPAEDPDGLPARHGRASAWYERHGLVPEAVRHALAAGDAARAAGLVELAALGMLGSSQENTLYGWLTALPDDAVRARPVLSTYYAFALFGRGGFDAAEARLRDAERWLDPPARADERRDAQPGEPVVADGAGFRSLPGTIAIARAYMAGAQGDIGAAADHARQALDLLPVGDHLWRGAAASLLGIARWTAGDLEAAHRSVADGMASLAKTGHLRFRISGAHMLADFRIAQGRLRAAVRIYEETVRLATAGGDPVWGTADLYVGLADLHRERGDLDAAEGYLRKSKELGEHAGPPETRHRWYVVMARVREARGDPDGALALLDEAERRYVESPDPHLRPVAAQRARLWVIRGRLADALGWARERGLSVEEDLSYLREFEHLTLARLLIARARDEGDRRALHDALGLLERLLAAAEAGERTGSTIETLVLLALAHGARGDVPRALAPLGRALALAEPEGYVRTFADEGEPLRALLRHAAAAGLAAPYARRLLAAFDPAPPPAPAAAAGLAEPLTPRELETLRLIAAGMRNAEIADHLSISPATVKRHIANAYAKLGVRHRTEAVARADALGLL